jgi:MFS family permease
MRTNFFRSWAVVAASIVVLFGFYGASGSFGLFLRPLEVAFGSTRTVMSGAMSTYMAVGGIVGIIAGRLTDRYGARVIIGIAALIGGLGYLLMSQVNSLWQPHIFFGIMAGSSVGACFTPIIATVSKLFTEKRVLMVGLTSLGMALGQMIVPPIVAFFMIDHEWRSAYILLAVVVWITVIPAVIFLRKKPVPDSAISLNQQVDSSISEAKAPISRQSKQWSVGAAMRTVPFWMFIIINFVTAAGFYIVLVHIIPFAIGSGIKSTDAALILTFLNGGTIAAQFVIWFLTMRLGSRLTIISHLAIQALALFLLMGANSFTVMIILGLVFGFGFGGSCTVRLSMISEIFGTHSTGTLLGLISVAWAVGGICGPILGGYVFDLSKSYEIAFLVGGLLLTVGSASGFFLVAPSRRA